jgi:hypothetical protein
MADVSSRLDIFFYILFSIAEVGWRLVMMLTFVHGFFIFLSLTLLGRRMMAHSCVSRMVDGSSRLSAVGQTRPDRAMLHGHGHMLPWCVRCIAWANNALFGLQQAPRNAWRGGFISTACSWQNAPSAQS